MTSTRVDYTGEASGTRRQLTSMRGEIIEILPSSRSEWNDGSMILHSLDEGFPLEDPPVLIPWGLSKDDLCRLLESHEVQQRTLDDDPAISCTALGGLPLRIRFCFDKNYGEQKYSLSLGRVDRGNLRESFEEIQEHLESIFGKPTITKTGEGGFPDSEWKFGSYSVTHRVWDFHDLIESVTIGPLYHHPASGTGLVRLINLTFGLLESSTGTALVVLLFIVAIVVHWITGQVPRLW